MYANVNSGQRHELVSRRMTASVETHWQHNAKNTNKLTATATRYLPVMGFSPRSVPSAPILWKQ